MIIILIIFILISSNIIYSQCEDNEYSTLGVLDNIDEQIYLFQLQVKFLEYRETKNYNRKIL